MRHRAFIESSVLMSGSIYAAKHGLQDTHFNESMHLLGWLETHIGIGVITQTVKSEVSKRLRKRVLELLDPRLAPREKSVALTQCEDRLHDISKYLRLEAIPDYNRFRERLVDVVILYAQLKNRASKRGRDIGQSVHESIANMPHYLRGVVSDIRREQFWKESAQLMRLRNKSLSRTDQEILAEAACLYEAYNRQEPTRLWVASTDTLMAPVLNEDKQSVKSATITKALNERFQINCDWPHRIAAELQATEVPDP